jgi:hypothetical protein
MTMHTPGLADCIALVTDPARAAARPGARAMAWAALKQGRGQTHRLDRLAPPPASVCDLEARLAATEPQRLARIRARAAQHGITPTGGDAA